MEQLAFGVDREYSRKQMLAACETVAKMWEERYYEEHSEFLEFPSRMITPKPFQDPHPPVWMACTSDESARIAGRTASGCCLQPGAAAREDGGRNRAVPRARSEPTPLTDVTTNKVAGYTLVHCADSMEDASRTTCGARSTGGTAASSSSS